MNKLTLAASVMFLIAASFKMAHCQQPLPVFTKYSSKQGLSSPTVHDIIQDRYGFIWLATEDGLNRFDGTTFKVYRHKPGNTNDLAVNYIDCLYESSDGCLWIGTNGGGLCYYDRNKDSVMSFHPEGPIFISAVINSLSGDHSNNLWVTTFGAVNVINPKNKSLSTLPSYAPLLKALEGKISTSFLEDSRQRIWIGTTEALYMFEVSNNKLKVFHHTRNDSTSLPDNLTTKIIEDKNGDIWVGTGNGLAKLHRNLGGFTNYYPQAPSLRLSNGSISSLAVDSKNRLWIGTEEGLNILDIATDRMTTCLPDNREPSSISSRSIKSIFIDKKGLHWIGTFRGGLNKYDENANNFNLKEYNAFDPKGLRSPLVTSFAPFNDDVFIGSDGGGLQQYHRRSGLIDYISLPFSTISKKHDLSILSLASSKDGTIWVGTFSNGLFNYNPATKKHRHYGRGITPADLNNNDIFCLKEDTKGNIWVGTNGGGINVISPGGNRIAKFIANPANPEDASAPANNFIRCFLESKDGKMWAGTFGAGLSVFDPITRRFRLYVKSNSDLPNNYVLCLTEDSKGNIWAGTAGSGIGLLKKGGNRFELVGEKEGLVNGSINTIIEDSLGRIWVSTNEGISYYDPKNKTFKNLTAGDRLQAGAFWPGAGVRMADGELFFGGQNGFNHINPRNLKTNPNKPQIVFTSLKVDNKIVTPGEKAPVNSSVQVASEIRLAYKQSFTIGFEALSFTVPEANELQYQLVGFDPTWVSAGKEHSAYYANLPPGQYTFKVRASNNDGVWNNEGKSIRIIISPPFWRSTYAYLLYFTIVVAMILYFRQLSVNRIKMRFAMAQEQQKAADLIERQRQQAEEQIERQRQEAAYQRQLDQQKIKFLTNLSHEFRTPLSLILGPVETLLEKSSEKMLTNQLNLIKRNSRRLLNLVNQLLDFRKMEEGELKLNLSEGDLVAFVKDVCDSFFDISRRKFITLDFHSSFTSLDVYFDHSKMERILFNLLANALKFTQKNGNILVELMEKTASPLQDHRTVSISVKDSGIGIPQKHLANVFDSFFQHATGSEIVNHGTGIGLSITKEFVELHGGTICVESEEGVGTNFTFHLTLRQSSADVKEQPYDKNTAVEHDAGSSEPSSILVIDDDDDFRYYLKEKLSDFRVFEAANGKEGWQRALFHHPDIIVCDIQMPVMGGHELVQKLKSDKRTKHIPVVLLTASKKFAGELDGLENGAIDYLTKPFNSALFIAKINNILQLNQSFKETYSKQVTVSLPESETLSSKEKFFQSILTYLNQNLSNPSLSVEAVSDHLFISRATLYNKIFEYTGKTPVEFIRSLKMDKAKELLEKGEHTVNEIAFNLGYTSPNYFTKVFKSQVKMTPSEYQQIKPSNHRD